MKIGIIGLGIVGGALKKHLETIRENGEALDFAYYDPRLGWIDVMDDRTVVFVCVPADTKADFKQDISILEQAVQLCSKNTTIFVRSTVLPGTTESLAKRFDRIVIPMPEFLTERTAELDASRLPIIVGSEKPFPFLHMLFPQQKIIYVPAQAAELGKYFHNIAGASKVLLANIVYDVATKLNIDYDKAKQVALASGLINDQHLDVPGPDGLFGFGGKCFPKDLKAFIRLATDLVSSYDLGTPTDKSEFLERILILNNGYRKKSTG